MVTKCSKINNARAQPLFCSLYLFVGGVLVAGVVVACLISLFLCNACQKMARRENDKNRPTWANYFSRNGIPPLVWASPHFVTKFPHFLQNKTVLLCLLAACSHKTRSVRWGSAVLSLLHERRRYSSTGCRGWTVSTEKSFPSNDNVWE